MVDIEGKYEHGYNGWLYYSIGFGFLAVSETITWFFTFLCLLGYWMRQMSDDGEKWMFIDTLQKLIPVHKHKAGSTEEAHVTTAWLKKTIRNAIHTAVYWALFEASLSMYEEYKPNYNDIHDDMSKSETI